MNGGPPSQGTESGGRSEARGSFRGDGLSVEEAGILLEEFREILGRGASGGISPVELRDRIRSLLSSLEEAPAPGGLAGRSVAALRSWSEVWVDEMESGRSAAADSVRTLLLVELMRLGRVLGEGA